MFLGRGEEWQLRFPRTSKTITIWEESMELHTEYITENSRHWEDVNRLAKEAFPPEEYLAPQALVKMAETDHIDFLALSGQDAFIGFMAVKIYKDLAYLFFLAIKPACRSKGYGSRAVETLKAKYPGKKQIVDFEMPDDHAQNHAQRKKRRDFYLRNGYQKTGLFLSYLGVDYEVFCMDSDFQEMMKTIHIKGFSPSYFHK